MREWYRLYDDLERRKIPLARDRILESMTIGTTTLTRVSLREEENEAPWAQKRTVANNDASKEISMIRGRNGGLAAW